MKNNHLEHIEDHIINNGFVGAQEAIQLLDDLVTQLSGGLPRINISVKWDGAPAIVCGKDPETKQFFVATKHGAFAKTPKLCFNLLDVDRHFPDPEMNKIMRSCLLHLRVLNLDYVLQGDVLFRFDWKEHRVIDGVEYITFRPNTIRYAYPVDSELGKQVEEAAFGIVFHTSYHGKTLRDSVANFGVKGLVRQIPQVFVQRTNTGEGAPITEVFSLSLSSQLTWAKFYLNSCSEFLNWACNFVDFEWSFGYLFKQYVNHLIKTETYSWETLFEFEKYLIEKFQTKIDSLKRKTVKDKYERLRFELVNHLMNHQDEFADFIRLYEQSVYVKNQLVRHLNFRSTVETFLETTDGLKRTSPEGYVVIDRNGRPFKLVDRLEFSAANFQNWDKK